MNDFNPDLKQLRHPQAALDFLAAMSGDPRFEKVADKKEDTDKNMREVLNRAERGEEPKGERTGKSRSEKLMAALLEKLYKENRLVEMREACRDFETMKKYLKELDPDPNIDYDDLKKYFYI